MILEIFYSFSSLLKKKISWWRS